MQALSDSLTDCEPLCVRYSFFSAAEGPVDMYFTCQSPDLSLFCYAPRAAAVIIESNESNTRDAALYFPRFHFEGKNESAVPTGV